jgi:hypothetical protein
VRVLFGLALFLLCAAQLDAGSPGAKQPVALTRSTSDGSEGLFFHPDVRSYLADLLRLSGGGYRHTERAAFLVIDERGGFRCLLWPYHNGFAREQFSGSIPAGTVAIAHTHPNSARHPSVHDRAEALRLLIPFLIVSRDDIYGISSHGEVVTVVEKERWSERIEKPGRCEAIAKRAR